MIFRRDDRPVRVCPPTLALARDQMHAGRPFTVPAPVVAQSWRGGSRQALLSRLLAGCDIEALDHGQADSVGSLAARAATGDIVDACVVEGALRRHDLVVSSDEDDLQAIAAAVSRRLEVDRP